MKENIENVSKEKITSFDVLGQRYDLPYSTTGNPTKEHILIESTMLFALKGYAAVSMRDIAAKAGVTPGALYNHFTSKEDLWEAVVDHAMQLYFLYHKNLDEALEKADTFEEVLEMIFAEPTRMKNMFTCYAFGLIQTEQFRSEHAGKIFNGTFLEYGIRFAQKWFDRCIERGLVRAFDTHTVATVFIHGVMIGINLKVQESLKRDIPYDITRMFEDLRQFILRSVSAP
ncbi:MAG: TetR/AcrR family transcriptional regulator [Synergistaceae bacterium]|jgi:AcrR family transcriptional regulator|nr:TetR/AcrR family transcriptional regulator [Synergistaceae bacterium]